MTEKICGTCIHHKHIYTNFKKERGEIIIDDGWVCINDNSANAGCYTAYDDTCDDWEEKE